MLVNQARTGASRYYLSYVFLCDNQMSLTNPDLAGLDDYFAWCQNAWGGIFSACMIFFFFFLRPLPAVAYR